MVHMLFMWNDNNVVILKATHNCSMNPLSFNCGKVQDITQDFVSSPVVCQNFNLALAKW